MVKRLWEARTNPESIKKKKQTTKNIHHPQGPVTLPNATFLKLFLVFCFVSFPWNPDMGKYKMGKMHAAVFR